jgi:hypothetical protein
MQAKLSVTAPADMMFSVRPFDRVLDSDLAGVLSFASAGMAADGK